jgi:hypothetical protein
MAYDNLSDFNKQRKSSHYKDEKKESFLLHINQLLEKEEVAGYMDLEERHPTIFVFGLPRSGTTFMTQLLAHSFELGYINNFMARFWLAPVTGIRLSRAIYGERAISSFDSSYASTGDILDIHEFGYFWRHWLHKNSITEILNSELYDVNIHWEALRRVILNIHGVFGSGWICKNIFGAYHLGRFSSLLEKSLFVYIQRDPVDNAISIMDARSRFYEDNSLWWSTVPMEYMEIKDFPVEEQVAAQVHYLRRYYDKELAGLDPTRYLRFDYAEVAAKPGLVISQVKAHMKEHYGIELAERDRPTLEFRTRTYADRQAERKQFSVLLSRYSAEK